MELEAVTVLGREILDSHGLGQWRFEFDRARTRAGMCDHSNQRITVSRHLLRLYDRDQVRDVILHEVAHALAGPKAGHGRAWAEVATRIGARPQRLIPATNPRLEGRWLGRCPAGHEVYRHRRPRRPVSCVRCARKFHPAHLLEWSYSGQPCPPAQLTPSYRRELAAIMARYDSDPAAFGAP